MTRIKSITTIAILVAVITLIVGCYSVPPVPPQVAVVTPVVIPTLRPYEGDSALLVDSEKLIGIAELAEGEEFNIHDIDTSYCSYILNRPYLSSLCRNNNDFAVFCTDIYTVFATSSTTYSLPIEMDITLDEAKLLIHAMFDDCPEFFNVAVPYNCQTNNDELTKLEFTYNMEHGDYVQALKSTYAVIQNWSSEITGMSEYEKEFNLYKKIIDNCEYSLTAENRRSAYGAIVKGKALCAGYSNALTMVLQYNGINATQVGGMAIDPETGTSESHAWNYVCIDGSYYISDPTWDDFDPEKIPMSKYSYLNVSDAMISRYRSPSEQYDNIRLPVCSLDNCTYYAMNNLIVHDGVDMQAYLHDKISMYATNAATTSEKAQTMHVQFETRTQFDYFIDNVYDIVRAWNETVNGGYIVKSYSYSQNASLNIIMITFKFASTQSN